MDTTEGRLAVLDSKQSDPFAQTFGPSLDAELADWIRVITSSGPTQQNFDRLNTLAWFIFVERQGTAFGEGARFNVGPTLAEFQEFVYAFNVFSVMDVPYDEWHSVVERLFAALKEMVDSNKINFQSAGCNAAREYLSEVLSCIRQDPEYDQRFMDLLNGAL
jgi:hypothetical protein